MLEFRAFAEGAPVSRANRRPSSLNSRGRDEEGVIRSLVMITPASARTSLAGTTFAGSALPGHELAPIVALQSKTNTVDASSRRATVPVRRAAHERRSSRTSCSKFETGPSSKVGTPVEPCCHIDRRSEVYLAWAQVRKAGTTSLSSGCGEVSLRARARTGQDPTLPASRNNESNVARLVVTLTRFRSLGRPVARSTVGRCS